MFALLLGVLVTLAIFIGSSRVLSDIPVRIRGLFAGILGFLTTLFLWDNPEFLMENINRIVVAGLAILLLLMGSIRKGIKK